MNEMINIAEILKDAPKGTPLYSTILGECTFDHISGGFIWVLSPKCDVAQAFTKEGYIVFKNTWCSEVCCLFPSKDDREWSTFIAPWKHKHFEPFQKVLTECQNHNKKYIWVPDLFGYYDTELDKYVTVSGRLRSEDEIIPYEGNEDKIGNFL